MKFKMTKEERNWVLYDVGNSAFVLLISTIMPIYFNYLAENAGLSSVDYLAYWGYAASIVTVIVAALGPVCGTLADTKGFKKPIFTATLNDRCHWLSGSWFCKTVADFFDYLYDCQNRFFRKPDLLRFDAGRCDE